MGTGGDYAAIQVIEHPSYKQVAEWRHNTTAPGQIRVLKDICDYIEKQSGPPNRHILECGKQCNRRGSTSLLLEILVKKIYWHVCK